MWWTEELIFVCWFYSQVAAVSFDALGGTETFSVVGVTHAGVTVAFTCCSQRGGGTKQTNKTKKS